MSVLAMFGIILWFVLGAGSILAYLYYFCKEDITRKNLAMACIGGIFGPLMAIIILVIMIVIMVFVKDDTVIIKNKKAE